MAIRFTNILKDLILESARLKVFLDKYVKPNKNSRNGMLPFQVLAKIVAADPTSNMKGLDPETATEEEMMQKEVRPGKYSQWLLNYFTKHSVESDSGITDPNSPAFKKAIKEWQDQFLEDIYKVTNDLMKYERFKSRLPQEYKDINKLTPETLYDQVKDFTLEKTKATADEKKEASKTYEHPGADIVYRGSEWTVAKISDKGQLGKDAACFYGGNHLEPSRGETRWCTSSPGLTWFERYINKGPLYVVIPNSPKKYTGSMDVGEKSGLPAYRYQFHFPDNQYMDPADRQIDLVGFLLQQEEGLREFFKPEFMDGLTQNNKDKITVNYPGDSASKFIALYGFDEFFDTLPENIRRLSFTYNGNEKVKIDLPESIGKFTNLNGIHIEGCLGKVPDSICNLKNLMFLSIPNNPDLEPLPACLAELPKLNLLAMMGSNLNGTIPQAVMDRPKTDKAFHIFDQKVL